MNRRIAALSLLSLAASGPALAQMLSDQAPPQHRIVHRNLLALRANPLGAGWEGRFAYRYRLYASESIALRDNFLGLGIAPGLTPTYARLGLYAEAQPTTFLGFWAIYEAMQYFGDFNQLQSFPFARVDFSDLALKAYPPGYPAFGTLFTFGVNVNLRFGKIIVRDVFKVVRPDFGLRRNDTVFYEQLSDLLLPNRRVTLINDLDVLYQAPLDGLFVGLRYSVGDPIYGIENGVAENSTHRLGPICAYRFFDHDGRRFNQPTVAVVVNWYLKHPYRTGQETPTAIPYFALAFQTSGDFLPLDPAPTKPVEAPPAPEAPASSPAPTPSPTPIEPEPVDGGTLPSDAPPQQ